MGGSSLRKHLASLAAWYGNLASPAIDWQLEPDPAAFPRYGDRRLCAAIHEQYFSPLSPRTLEKWPLKWRHVNGYAVTSIPEFLAEAQRRFDSAPVIAA